MSKRTIKQPNRGLYKKLYAIINTWEQPGGVFNEEHFKGLKLPKNVITGGLNYLANHKGLIDHGPMKGTWQTKALSDDVTPRKKDAVTVVIEDLLTAMARAEPVLKKMTKIQALLKEI